MSEAENSLWHRVRPPAHTGAKRCWPCTAVNLAIAAVLGVAGSLVASLLGVAVFLAGVGLVALRGYLVPGTPALTERYLPERVRLAIGADHPTDERTPDPSEFETLERVACEREHAVDPDAFLTETGVCQAPETTGADAAPPTVDPTLTAAFAAAQNEAIDTLRESGVTEAAVARAFDVDEDAVAAVAADQPSYEVGSRVRTWPSPAALVHDVATDRALREWTDRWTEVPRSQRVSLLASLRRARDRCPACGGLLERTDDLVPSCCGSFRVHAVVCADCGDHLIEEDRTAGTAKLR